MAAPPAADVWDDGHPDGTSGRGTDGRGTERSGDVVMRGDPWASGVDSDGKFGGRERSAQRAPVGGLCHRPVGQCGEIKTTFRPADNEVLQAAREMALLRPPIGVSDFKSAIQFWSEKATEAGLMPPGTATAVRVRDRSASRGGARSRSASRNGRSRSRSREPRAGKTRTRGSSRRGAPGLEGRADTASVGLGLQEIFNDAEQEQNGSVDTAASRSKRRGGLFPRGASPPLATVALFVLKLTVKGWDLRINTPVRVSFVLLFKIWTASSSIDRALGQPCASIGTKDFTCKDAGIVLQWLVISLYFVVHVAVFLLVVVPRKWFPRARDQAYRLYPWAVGVGNLLGSSLFYTTILLGGASAVKGENARQLWISELFVEGSWRFAVAYALLLGYMFNAGTRVPLWWEATVPVLSGLLHSGYNLSLLLTWDSRMAMLGRTAFDPSLGLPYNIIKNYMPPTKWEYGLALSIIPLYPLLYAIGAGAAHGGLMYWVNRQWTPQDFSVASRRKTMLRAGLAIAGAWVGLAFAYVVTQLGITATGKDSTPPLVSLVVWGTRYPFRADDPTLTSPMSTWVLRVPHYWTLAVIVLCMGVMRACILVGAISREILLAEVLPDRQMVNAMLARTAARVLGQPAPRVDQDDGVIQPTQKAAKASDSDTSPSAPETQYRRDVGWVTAVALDLPEVSNLLASSEGAVQLSFMESLDKASTEALRAFAAAWGELTVLTLETASLASYLLVVGINQSPAQDASAENGRGRPKERRAAGQPGRVRGLNTSAVQVSDRPISDTERSHDVGHSPAPTGNPSQSTHGAIDLAQSLATELTGALSKVLGRRIRARTVVITAPAIVTAGGGSRPALRVLGPIQKAQNLVASTTLGCLMTDEGTFALIDGPTRGQFQEQAIFNKATKSSLPHYFCEIDKLGGQTHLSSPSAAAGATA